MKRILLGCCVSIAVVGFAARADAESPDDAPAVGDPGHWAISLERAFGVDYAKSSPTMNGVALGSSSATGVSVFGNPPVGTTGVFSFPRVGVDASVGARITVGTALGFGYGSLSNAAPVGGTSMSSSFTSFVLAPRIGYALPISAAVAFWPRLGVSGLYAALRPAGGLNSENLTLIAVTVEAPFVITLVPRVALTLGPTVDLSLFGRASSGGNRTDESIHEIGGQAGLTVTL